MKMRKKKKNNLQLLFLKLQDIIDIPDNNTKRKLFELPDEYKPYISAQLDEVKKKLFEDGK